MNYQSPNDYISNHNTNYTVGPSIDSSWKYIDNISNFSTPQHSDEIHLNFLTKLMDEYFDEHNVDIEEVTMKDVYDFIVKKEPKLIAHVPQTIERCKLALSTEWSNEVKEAIKLPFTGELHKFYLKMKLTNGTSPKKIP